MTKYSHKKRKMFFGDKAGETPAHREQEFQSRKMHPIGDKWRRMVRYIKRQEKQNAYREAERIRVQESMANEQA